MLSATKLSVLAERAGGTLHGPSGEVYIRHLLVNSRKQSPVTGTLFVALNGERHDGHDFISELYERGYRSFLVERKPELPDDARYILVDDTLQAMQAIAGAHREQCQASVLAITGSNGKTIVKEWLHKLLWPEINVSKSPKSYNSQVGVALSLWHLRRDARWGLFEAGISQPGEMAKLERMLSPTIGLFTYLGSAHDEGFSSRQEKAREKARLFVGAEKVIFRADHPEIEKALRYHGLTEDRFVTWSTQQEANFTFTELRSEGQNTLVTGHHDNTSFSLTIPFIDKASIENALHAFVATQVLGLPMDVVAPKLRKLNPVAMRLRVLEGINDCTIIDDVYNSDLNSLKIGLDLLDQQRQHQKRTLILSDILESGLTDEVLYQQVNQLIATHQVSQLIGIGPAIGRQANLFSENTLFFPDTKTFLTQFEEDQFQKEAILVKGSRIFQLEDVTKRLQQMAHETVLEIDLTNLVDNLNQYRSKLEPDTMLMAMVKAHSYGAGSFEIANLLEYERVDYLAVAYTDEGVELRQAGIELPIMVMNPERAGYASMLRNQLEPEIYSLRTLRSFGSAAEKRNETGPFPIHLKLDTGMHRLGFGPDEIEGLITSLQAFPKLKVESVFTHLAAADASLEDNFTRDQITSYLSMVNALEDAMGYSVIKHVVNSAGILRFPEAHFDMVRLGIGMYGIASHPNHPFDLKTVATLRTSISQIKNIAAGETIGYGRKGKATQAMRIATLPIGYADGFSRAFSNGVGWVSIHGKKAPVIGNVCMDMTMIDLTGIEAKEGDMVEVFGANNKADDLAKAIDTIAYELLTAISKRVKRVYAQN